MVVWGYNGLPLSENRRAVRNNIVECNQGALKRTHTRSSPVFYVFFGFDKSWFCLDIFAFNIV